MRHDLLNLERHGQEGRRAGVSLIELLLVVVILGIVGAIVVPKLSDASTTTRENTLKHDLRYLRTQIIVFKAQHSDTAPGYPGGRNTAPPSEQDFLLQMTGFTDEFCNIAGPKVANRLGPYISKMPKNPLNGMGTIMIVPNGSSMPPAGRPDNSSGWIYKPATLEIIPNSPSNEGEGTPCVEY